ncbi:MAG: response regulator transcription factor [Chloroflexota bacterium]
MKEPNKRKDQFKPADKSHYNILIVEDEAPLRHLLFNSLRKVGYTVFTATNGKEALSIFNREEIDLLMLDVVMPLMNGLETCQAIRSISNVPIIMLTALSRPDDIVRGFEYGADDYITKPFTFREVEIRLHAIFRRMTWIENPQLFPIIAFEGFTFDNQARQVIVNDRKISLTPIECKLLVHLMNMPHQPVDKNALFRSAWGYDINGGRNLVEVAMRRLRQKIEEDPSKPSYLVTVRSAGYKFVPPKQVEMLAAASPEE